MAKEFRDFHQLIAETAGHYRFSKPSEAFSSFQEWFTDFVRWLSQQFQVSFQANRVDTSAMGNMFKLLLYGVGIACAGLGIYILFLRLRQEGNKKRSSTAGAALASVRLSSREWLSEADKLVAAQDWRAACRSLYMGCLRLLDESDVVAFNPTRTNIEYYYALGGNKVIQKVFRELANLVDSFWFGDRMAKDQDFDTCKQLLNEIQVSIEENAKSKQQ
jgi:hypothetical protein